MSDFASLVLSQPLVDAIGKLGFVTPTAIQEQAIPVLLKDESDLIGLAQTGTGKTAAFGLPLIDMVDEKEKVTQALVLAPTRELAIQIDDNIKDYSKHTKIRHAVIFGGVKQHKQVQQLKGGVHILVATPGRLLDLIGQGLLSIETVKLFVLDEADRMLDMGFIHDINKLLKLLPKERQSLFFSATMPNNIKKLSDTILNNPSRVEVAPVSSTAETIQQFIYYTNRDKKRNLLLHILERPDIEEALIFTRTKHGADRVARHLHKNGIKSASIHGDKAQNQRQKALNQFKEGKIRVLVATDIAARGIDIDKLKHVINFEVPNIAETYVHRIGRSGRAGEEGVAISLCEPEENAHVRGIEKLIGKKIEKIEDNPFPQTDKPMTEAEKKEWEKEKQRRKQEFFANRKKNGGGRGRDGGRGRGSRNDKPKAEKKRSDQPKGERKPKDNRNEKPARPEGQSQKSRPEGQQQKAKPEGQAKKARPEGSKSSKPQNSRNDERSGGKKKPYNKKKGHGGKKKTGMSPSLKGKFMWPLEK